MGLIEVIILAVGLAMDAFAVSVCKGLAMKKGIQTMEVDVLGAMTGI